MFNLTNCNKTPIKIFLIVLVIIFGIYLRTIAYFQNNSIFLDEGLLILNFAEKHYGEMFFKLAYNQASPPLFLILSKFVYQIFGVNEMALRFIPYVASVLSLILFYFLSSKVFKNYFTISLALFAFAINPQLIWMTGYLKPYIVDVLLTIIALIVALNIDLTKIDKKKALLLGLLSALSVWFSYAMLFVVAGLSFVYLAEILSIKDKELIKNFWIYATPNIVGFFLYFILNLLWVSNNLFLHRFWMTSYSFAPKTYSDLKSIIDFIFQYADIRVILPLLLLGVYLFFKKDNFKAWILVFPVLITLIASFLDIYPFANRLILFVVPIAILLIFKPLDEISFKNKLYSCFVIVLVWLSLFPICKFFCASVITNKFSFSYAETRAGYEKLRQDIKPDEIVYVYFYSFPSFKSYNLRLKIPDNQIVYGRWRTDNLNKYPDDLDKLPKDKAIWFVLLNEPYAQKEINIISTWINANCKVEKKSIIEKVILVKAHRK